MYTIYRKRSHFSFCSASRWTSYAAGIITMATVSTMAGAQAVKVAPDVITVDQATHTAKVQFTNTTSDTATVDLALKASMPGAADSAKRDSLARLRSLSAWITNMPASLTLAPHETRTVALNLTVPTSLDAGEYWTYLVVQAKGKLTVGDVSNLIPGLMMRAQGMTDHDLKNAKSDSNDKIAGGVPAEPFAATKIVYQAKGKQQKQTP
jgi:hypothetical protein